jgi:hypothetical protein
LKCKFAKLKRVYARNKELNVVTAVDKRVVVSKVDRPGTCQHGQAAVVGWLLSAALLSPFCAPQLRRQTRERREYLYRKSLETQEKTIHERKRRFKDAFEAGKPIPSDLRGDAAELQKAIALDDASTEGLPARGCLWAWVCGVCWVFLFLSFLHQTNINQPTEPTVGSAEKLAR